MAYLQMVKDDNKSFFMTDFVDALSPFLTVRDKVCLHCIARCGIRVLLSATQRCLKHILKASAMFESLGLRPLKYQDRDFVLFRNNPFHHPTNFTFALSFSQPGYLQWWFQETSQCEWKEVSLHLGLFFRFVVPQPEYLLAHTQDLICRVVENISSFVLIYPTYPAIFACIKKRKAAEAEADNTFEFSPPQ